MTSDAPGLGFNCRGRVCCRELKQNSYNALVYGICELVRLCKGEKQSLTIGGCDNLIDLCPDDQGRLDGDGGMEEPGALFTYVGWSF